MSHALHKHLEELVVLVDVFVVDAVGAHASDEGVEVFAGCNLDAYERRTFLLVGLLDVLDVD